MHSLRCQLLFPVQNTKILNNIALTDVLSSILKTPQDNDKIHCVKKHWKFIGNPAKNNPNSKIQFKNPTRNPNLKIQLEILTQNPNSKSNSKIQFINPTRNLKSKIQLENPTENPNSKSNSKSNSES